MKCELCGRAYAQKALTPYWYPHKNICDRSNCRQAVRDAVEAIEACRERQNELVGAIAKRHRAQWAAVAWRGDTMAKFDVVENRDWWATNIAKRSV